MTSTSATVRLNDGFDMPRIGLGVFRMDTAEARTAVTAAAAAGYVLVDTAAGYDNEGGVGSAVATIGRERLFITTKLRNEDQGRDETLRAFDRSMSLLGIETLDLYLIHWPAPARDRYVETWQTLVELQRSGRVRSIGVSNFEDEHLRRVIDATGVVPAVNQIELHPLLPQAALRARHRELGIVTEAWSPLGAGNGLLEHPVIIEIASRHDSTAAQVVLAWHLAVGDVVIPKSSSPSRMQENLAAGALVLTAQDLSDFVGIENGRRFGPHPNDFE